MTHTAVTYVCECGRRIQATTVVQEFALPVDASDPLYAGHSTDVRCDAPRPADIIGGGSRCYLTAGHQGNHSWQSAA